MGLPIFTTPAFVGSSALTYLTSANNQVAIGAFVLGVAPSLPGFIATVSGHPAGGFFGGVYNWAWFVGFLVAAAVYVTGMKARG